MYFFLRWSNISSVGLMDFFLVSSCADLSAIAAWLDRAKWHIHTRWIRYILWPEKSRYKEGNLWANVQLPRHNLWLYPLCLIQSSPLYWRLFRKLPLTYFLWGDVGDIFVHHVVSREWILRYPGEFPPGGYSIGGGTTPPPAHCVYKHAQRANKSNKPPILYTLHNSPNGT